MLSACQDRKQRTMVGDQKRLPQGSELFCVQCGCWHGLITCHRLVPSASSHLTSSHSLARLVL